MTNKAEYTLYGRQSIEVSYVAKYLMLTMIIFIGLSYYYSAVGYKKALEPFMEFIRAIGIVEYFFFIFLSLTSLKYKSLLKVLVLSIGLLVLLIKLTYFQADVDIFGLAKDSYNYLNFGVKYGDGSFGVLVRELVNGRYFVDDMGYFAVTYLFWQIYPDVDFVVYGMIAFNLLCLYISGTNLYKLSRMLNNSDLSSKLIIAIWCASPFLMLTISDGMKEVVFTTIIISSFYKFYQYKREKNLFNLFVAIALAILCLFFRTAVFYMLVLIFIIILTMNNRNKKMYFIMLVSGLIVVDILLPIVVEKIMGISLDFIMEISSGRTERAMKDQASYGSMLPLISAILGPFPTLDRPARYAIEYSSAIYVKDIFGLSFFCAVYDKVKRLDIDYIPLLVYILVNLLMLFTAGVSLDMRYHMTYLPFFFLIAVPYLKRRKLWNLGFIIILVIIIYLYSTRRVTV